jgi:hypothetical protein
MMWQDILRRLKTGEGILLTILIGAALTAFYFGPLFQRPSHTYFSKGGDGFQIYYESVYHVKYDTKWWHQESANYPYGESIFFTGSMPLLNNFAKIFGSSSGSFCVWLINMMMLLSPLLGAVFLYLLFRHLKLPWIYAAIAANGVAFLSPQMIRMSGHYSLSWIFLLPAFIYLLLKFYEYPNLKKSWVIFFLVLLGGMTHMYFLAFFLALGGVYWIALFVTRDRGFGRFLFSLKHFSIQLLLPLVLVQVITLLTDPVADRTAFPWGYLYYHATFDGVFYPFNLPYAPVFDKVMEHEYPPDWEGFAYVGFAAILGLLILAGVQAYRFVRLRFHLLLSVSDSKPMNILFWTSVFLLWISCAHPFIDEHQNWLEYLGPLRQFRAVGRFSWPFFYLANIVVVYRMFKIFKNVPLRFAICAVILGLLYFDGYYNTKGLSEKLANRIPELEDKANALPENQWLKKIDATKYQAILPLPLYCTSSENIARFAQNEDVIFRSYLVSLQTGLPIMSTAAARTSIGQSVKMISVILDPNGTPTAVNDLPNEKPLLLMVIDNGLNENEKRIVSYATLLDETPKFRLYSITPKKLAEIPRLVSAETKAHRDTAAKISRDKFLLSDSAVLIYNGYDQSAGEGFHGKGVFTADIRDYSRIVDTALTPGDYLVSFWMDNMTEDIYPRTVVETVVFDSAGKSLSYDFTASHWKLKAIDGKWGLLEIPVHIADSTNRLTVTLWNDQVKKGTPLRLDELIIRPSGIDIFRKDEIYFRNNRYYTHTP